MPVTIMPASMKHRDGNSFVTADCIKGDPGSPGDPTELIDDTAGSGITNKTWSANKVYTEVDGVKGRVAVLEPTASNSDVGKVLSAKTVLGSKVSEYEFVSLPSAGAQIDDTTGSGTTNKTWSANKITSELALKADKSNPSFSGSFTHGRKENTTVGEDSFSFGYHNEASGELSIALGYVCTAEGDGAMAIGDMSTANAPSSFAACHGGVTENANHGASIGYACTTSGVRAFSEGNYTTAAGYYSHSEGDYTLALSKSSHAEGSRTTAYHENMHVAGVYNVVKDANYLYPPFNTAQDWYIGDMCSHEGKAYTAIANSEEGDDFIPERWEEYTIPPDYAEVIGNGVYNLNPNLAVRSNARALDWDGNEYLKGTLVVQCNADSSGGKRLVFNNDHTITWESAT